MDFDSYLWAAVPAITLMLIIYLVGFFGNVMVVWATFRSKSLSSTCNYLIAFESIASTIHVTAHWYLGYLIYTGINAVPLQRCTMVMTIPIIGLCVGNVFVLMIALDRLAMVIAPMQYRRVNKTYYLVLSCVLGFAYAIYTLLISYFNASNFPNMKVICIIVEAMHGRPFSIYSAISLIMNIITFCCYGLIIAVLKLKNQKADKLFKPLMIMIMVIFFSWFLSSVCSTLVSLSDDDALIFYTPLYVGITVNISCACNFYILYFMSSEYRQNFRALLSKIGLYKKMPINVNVVSVSTSRK
uniref:G_PROTEIN_RECEP_F1_2 domain-containing protein n=1 Tax=Panagrellus redivivus TaxID=6233 RepID=A0A7E4V084_PANRE